MTTPTQADATGAQSAESADVRAMAQALLDAHDALCKATAAEPPRDEDGTPLDSNTWLRWYSRLYKPRYTRFVAAHTAFEQARGAPTSRHPFNFRPLCEEILS